MFEFFHTVLTTLLLSTAAGGSGADPRNAGEDEPAGNETGLEIGHLQTHLLVPRGVTTGAKDQPGPDDDHLPSAGALATQVAFCEPAVSPLIQPASCKTPCDAAPFPTSGRSP